VGHNTQLSFPGYLQNVSENGFFAVDIFGKVYQYGTSTFDAVDLALETADIGNAGCFGAPGRDISWCHIVNLRKASWFDSQRSLVALNVQSVVLLLREVSEVVNCFEIWTEEDLGLTGLNTAEKSIRSFGSAFFGGC
jgi:hypothetical protein